MSKPRSVTKQRLGASSGIVAPILAFIFILSAIASYPQFSWTNNALSDLGVVPGITEQLFNFGLLASGVLALNFALFGLFTYFWKNWVGVISSAVFVAASIALMGIGIFNESFSPTHYLVSVAFFVLMPISMLIMTGALALKHQVTMAAFTALMALVATTPWTMYYILNFVSGVAIPEFASALAGSVWMLLFGYKMLKEA